MSKMMEITGTNADFHTTALYFVIAIMQLTGCNADISNL